ncbi:hypothetical protein HZS_740 [Henneguya salminicola]|nr:hypothetical protein HZS_740 [Henneguya salminicola]
MEEHKSSLTNQSLNSEKNILEAIQLKVKGGGLERIPGHKTALVGVPNRTKTTLLAIILRTHVLP